MDFKQHPPLSVIRIKRRLIRGIQIIIKNAGRAKSTRVIIFSGNEYGSECFIKQRNKHTVGKAQVLAAKALKTA